MPRASRAKEALPAVARKAVTLLGRDIATARTRRRIPQRLFAERMMVSLDTVQRLERGDPGVSLGVLVTALWALGLADRVATLASPSSDTLGTAEEIGRLPRRVRSPKPDSSMDF
jgi:transcriptional regulator with XRE-family HTH domain